MAHTLDLNSARLHDGAAHGSVLRQALGNLDVSRIAAETGAIAVHVAALLLLLAPMSPPPEMTQPEEIIVYLPDTKKKNPEPPKVEPKVVEIRPKTAAPTTPITQPVQQVEVPPILVDDPTPIDVQGADVIADVTPTRTNTISEPLSGAHLEYETAPPPRYPPDAMKGGVEGTVVLRVLVGLDGKPLEVSIERSSGNRSLDAAARRQVLSKWRFKAAMQNGQAVQAIGLVPIDFNLH